MDGCVSVSRVEKNAKEKTKMTNWGKASSELKLLAAVSRADLTAVASMLQSGVADPAVQENAAIVEAAALGHANVVKLLLSDSRVNAAARDSAAIQWAARNNNAHVVQILLERPEVDVSANDNAALRWAVQNGCELVIALLLRDKRVDPGALKQEALGEAVAAQRWRIVTQLLAHRMARPHANDQALLMRSVASRDWRTADSLLAHPGTMLHGVVDMKEHARDWRSLEASAARLSALSELDGSLALVINAERAGVSAERLRVITLLSSASHVLRVVHVLLAAPLAQLPLMALIGIMQALHTVVARMHLNDLALVIVHAVSQRRRLKPQ